MKLLFCWRCQEVVPMLDEDEYRIIHKIYGECFHDGRCPGLPEKWKPVRDAYSEMTGAPDTFHNAIMHHRIALYGPQCVRCGKPLRSPKASFCAACGQVREKESAPGLDVDPRH